jgi:hypothetical protein
MGTFTVPSELATLLGQLKERTELRDTDGNLIGFFAPQVENESAENREREPLWTPEEAERLWEEQRHLPGRPLAEFWRELKGEGGTPE